MKNYLRLLGKALIYISVITSITAVQANNSTDELNTLLASEHRSTAHKDRDKYRNPVETLTWFGLKHNMTVVEIYPGGGWYTEILAPFLKDKGKYYAAGYDSQSSVGFFQKGVKNFKEKMAARPDLYGNVSITELAPTRNVAIAPNESADMILTFRNIHNWMDAGYANDVFSSMYKALKPGGILGLVEHRGNPDQQQDPKAESGYVNEDYAIALAEKAGFKLVEKSSINANPKDTKDYPKGVWTLPPTLVEKNKDREKYLAIGESDRMTLKFIK